MRRQRKTVAHVRLFNGLLFAVLLGTLCLAGTPSEGASAKPQCPPPTVGHGGQCVLTTDVVLSKALEPASSTRINCKGHRLTPAFRGVSDNPATPGNEYVPSQPVVAILLNGAHGVSVQNCVIDDFDFGVVIVDAKVPPDDSGDRAQRRNRILANTITSRYQGVTVMQADHNVIKGNTITYHSGGGAGIVVWRDSDRNLIENNTVTGSADPPEAAPKFPGDTPENFFSAAGIALSNDSRAGALFNLIIGDTLFQVPWSEAGGPEDNVVEGNTVQLRAGHPPQSFPVGVSVIGNHVRPIIRENTITTVKGAFIGIVAGGSIGIRKLPGTCSLDPTRSALSDADCFIPGVDTKSKGTAVGVVSRFVDDRSRAALLEKNTVTGLFVDGIQATHTMNAIILENRTSGASRSGVLLTGPALQDATVTGSVMSDNAYGLALVHDDAAFFGARVFLNDITRSGTRAILVGRGYAFATELSTGGRGNYWGRSCADDAGFVEAGKPRADSPTPLVVDSHPFGVPVAESDDDDLPPPCR